MRSSACASSLSTEGRSRRLIGFTCGLRRPAGGLAPAEEPLDAAKARGEQGGDGRVEEPSFLQPRACRAEEADPNGLAEQNARRGEGWREAAIEVGHKGNGRAGERHEPKDKKDPDRQHAEARVNVEDEAQEAQPADEGKHPRGEGEAEGVFRIVGHEGNYSMK